MLALILFRLTFQDVLADLPHDAAAILTYTLLGVLIAFVWLGSRNRGGSPPASGQDHVQ